MRWLDARKVRPTEQVLVRGLLPFGMLSLMVGDFGIDYLELDWISGDCDIVGTVKDYPYYQTVEELERFLGGPL